ncbi:PadR family transcriptional regulator [Marinoscillum sp.]|uniref:PadR family transcriptional regulator n=1 Tax=Marinoscillum sp. TaxID=2024838 RepID=UPI003BAB9D2F
MNLQLGVLEELILIILLIKHETYGVDIAKEYQDQLDQSISLPAIHVVLKRLEKKGLVSSEMGEPTAERGGRRKRIYRATNKGYKAARDLQEKRSEMWKLVPKLNFNL